MKTYELIAVATVFTLIVSMMVLMNVEEVEATSLTMRTDLSESYASFWGEDPDDYAGYSIAGAGDVNGDGYDDILIGAYGDDDGGNGAGQTYLIFGKAAGWSMDMDLSNVDASFWGEDAIDLAGYSIAGAGDVNGDGYDDILIGAYGDDDGGNVAGQTYLIFGKAAGWAMDTDLSNADASFWGEDAGDLSGFSISSAGDVNGDGYDDIVIGAYGDSDGGSGAGQIYLILGKATGWSMDNDLSSADASFWGEDSGDNAGYSIAGVGDVNGDGYDDFLIGAHRDDDGGSSAGQAYLIFGQATGWSMDTDLSNVDASFWGEDASDYAGFSVSGAGDVNGDGYDDLIIGATNNGDGGQYAGQTYLILGKSSGWSMDTDLSSADASFIGETEWDYSGRSVAGAGDFDGDGYNDFAIGAHRNDDGGADTGQTYLILGKESGWAMDTYLSNADASFIGETPNDLAGLPIAGAGDVNGDGCDDILIGVYYNDEAGSDAGQIYLLVDTTPPKPQDLEAHLSADGDSIQLSWNPSYTKIRGTQWYMVYRTEDGQSYSVYDYVDGDSCTYTDTQVDIGIKYYYAVTTLSGGFESSLSDPIGIINDKDPDQDGLGNQYDLDDDGDGISDPFDQNPLVEDNTAWSRMDVDLGDIGIGFIGEDAWDSSGRSLTGVGDVNGDGYDDIFIGASGDDDGGSGAGQTYLILGKASGWNEDNDLSNADASFWGEDSGDISGYSVSGVGDVNGDGYDDFLIGAYNDEDGGGAAGQTYLILGKASGWTMDTDLANADASFWGEYTGDRSGSLVAGAGDVNGDGYDDILIGAEGNDEGGAGAGQTYLILGKASGWVMDTDLSDVDASFWGEGASDDSGWSVASGGDVNGDGYDDFLIGAPGDDDGGSNAGQTYLILGKASGWGMDTDLSNADASFWGEEASDSAGRTVAGVGDVNRDGYDDILIGADGSDDGGSNAGQTYLILGKASGWGKDTDLSNADASFWGEDTSDFSGVSIAGIGDVNGDGYDDFIIGANGDDDGGSNAGQTYLILGKTSGWSMDTDLSTADVSFWGEDANDGSGQYIGGAGDVNGDGFDEMLIGAIGDDDGGSGAGRTYLINRTYLPKVAGVDVTNIVGESGLNISWTDSIDDPFFYGIYRGPDPHSLHRLNTTTNSWYDDIDVAEGVTYVYAVVAVCPLGGESPLSFTDPIQCDFSLNQKLDDMNLSIDSDLAQILAELLGHRDDFSSYESDFSRNMTSLIANLNGLDSQISFTMNSILNDMDGFNDTLRTRIDDLELELKTDILAFTSLLESVNASLIHELSMLDSDMSSLRDEMRSDLQALSTAIAALSDDLEGTENDLMSELDEINSMIDDLGTISIPELSTKVDLLALQVRNNNTEIQEMLPGIPTRKDSYDSPVKTRLENMAILLEALEEMEQISEDIDEMNADLETLQTLEEKLSDVEKEQSDTSSSVGLVMILLIIILILLIGIIGLMGFQIFIKGKVQEEPEKW